MTDPHSRLHGRCACGALDFALTPPTEFVSHCHCATCRRVHAAPFVTWTAVPPSAYELRAADVLRTFDSSPGVRRHFCGRCGSPVAYEADGVDKVYVPAALLDRLDRPPDSHVSYEERAPWLADVEALPCFIGKSDRRTPWRDPGVAPSPDEPEPAPPNGGAAPARFSAWRPLALGAPALADHAVVQFKVLGRLLNYPLGQSAMVWYGVTPRDGADLSALAARAREELPGATLVWRSLPTPDPERRLEPLLSAFRARFGGPPRCNRAP